MYFRFHLDYPIMLDGPSSNRYFNITVMSSHYLLQRYQMRVNITPQSSIDTL